MENIYFVPVSPRIRQKIGEHGAADLRDGGEIFTDSAEQVEARRQQAVFSGHLEKKPGGSDEKVVYLLAGGATRAAARSYLRRLRF